MQQVVVRTVLGDQVLELSEVKLLLRAGGTHCNFLGYLTMSV